MDNSTRELGLFILTYDPEKPQPELFTSATEAALFAAQTVKPVPVPWPPAWTPTPAPPPEDPNETDELPQNRVLLITWTVGEARTMAQLLTPNVSLDDWYEYRNNVDSFIPKVTGQDAPFNNPKSPRYYHSLGLYYPLRIGQVSVLAFKSGLHMAYDGPQVPVIDLFRQIIDQVKPELIITTGTAGAIGSDVQLGDVVIASATLFDLIDYLKDKCFNKRKYSTVPVPLRIKDFLSDALLKPNGALLDPPRVPSVLLPTVPNCVIVSADTFAFDDSTNYFHLQGLGKTCEMGDACLGYVMNERSNRPAWYAIRNASEPQISNPDHDIKKAGDKARAIYGLYQMVASAGSLVASWAAIAGTFPGSGDARLSREASVRSLEEIVRRDPISAETVLLMLASGQGFARRTVQVSKVDHQVREVLRHRLATKGIDAERSSTKWAALSFTDAISVSHNLYQADVMNSDGAGFMGTYLISGTSIVVAREMTH
jgi:hypothetical protein